MTNNDIAWIFIMALVGLNVGVWGTLFFLKWKAK